MLRDLVDDIAIRQEGQISSRNLVTIHARHRHIHMLKKTLAMLSKYMLPRAESKTQIKGNDRILGPLSRHAAASMKYNLR